MRILPTALVASVAIHSTLLGWAIAHKIEIPAVVAPEMPTVEIETVKPAPPVQEIAVALLDDHTIATIPQSHAPGDVHAPVHHSSQISTTTSASTTGHTETTAADHHAPMMTMREPAKKDLKGPSDEFWKKFDENSKPLQPKEIAGEQIEDDYARANEHLNNEGWLANSTSDEINAEREKRMHAQEARESHELQPDGRGTKAQHATFTGRVDPDGTAHIDQKRSYDPTEILMHSHNIDPYASNKKKFLDGTRDERYQIGKKYKEQQLAQSAVIAKKNLDYLWAKTTSTSERKEALFEMWDDVRGDRHRAIDRRRCSRALDGRGVHSRAHDRPAAVLGGRARGVQRAQEVECGVRSVQRMIVRSRHAHLARAQGLREIEVRARRRW